MKTFKIERYALKPAKQEQRPTPETEQTRLTDEDKTVIFAVIVLAVATLSGVINMIVELINM